MKLNVVVIKGVNDQEVVDLARFARDQRCVARFVEYMDLGTVNAWDPERVVSARDEELRETIRSLWSGRLDLYSEQRTAGLRSGRLASRSVDSSVPLMLGFAPPAPSVVAAGIRAVLPR